ncbi:hypothetical protein BACOVA_04790 [Bacteroides ovatus ATCC 8483]|uniref:Uncharacterized protein n=1 Tax=Bacteroides ovatus (strain ATCC 8483 / DSM 1896 / JCM 5824 / BCRC 10623 / CCUG 4943 / NCTC 11153) TaxID=411476 RepID=A0AAN3A335_BACO1|nr:hypothetical protein BACOVA_04790 [Bacteroides ovatus ATCC 8483]
MTEDVAIFLVGKRIATILVLLGNKIQKSLHIFFMNKVSRFTQYIYKMQTTPNKVIINKL